MADVVEIGLCEYGELSFILIKLHGRPLSIPELVEADRHIRAADATKFGKVKLHTLDYPEHPELQFLGLFPSKRNVVDTELKKLARNILPRDRRNTVRWMQNVSLELWIIEAIKKILG